MQVGPAPENISLSIQAIIEELTSPRQVGLTGREFVEVWTWLAGSSLGGRWRGREGGGAARAMSCGLKRKEEYGESCEKVKVETKHLKGGSF